MVSRPPRDAAVSSVIGIVLMVGVVVMLTTGIYVWVSSSYATGASIPRFPQVILKDASGPCTAGAADELFTMEHVGGDNVAWDDFTFQVLDGSTDQRSVLDLGAASVGNLPIGLNVGEVLTATETTNVCTAGATELWKIRVIASESDNQIVYEAEVPIR